MVDPLKLISTILSQKQNENPSRNRHHRPKLLSLIFFALFNFFTLILVHQYFGHRHSVLRVKIHVSFLEAGDVGDPVFTCEVLFSCQIGQLEGGDIFPFAFQPGPLHLVGHNG